MTDAADNPVKPNIEIDAATTICCQRPRNLAINQTEAVEFSKTAIT